MRPYVSFLLDLAGSGAPDDSAVRLVDGTIRFQPGTTPRPRTAFQWKVSVCTGGLVVVRELRKRKLVVIATAEWREDKLADHRQRDTSVPTAYQWNLVQATVRHASAMAARANRPPTRPRHEDAPSPAERRALIPTPPELLAESVEIATPARQRWAEARAGAQRSRSLVVGFVGAVVLVVVAMFVVRCASTKDAPRHEAPIASAPVAQPEPPAPEEPASPRPAEPVPAAVTDPTIESASSFAEALALAKPQFTPHSRAAISPGAAALARYRKLQWSDVAGPPETTLGMIAKDAEAELGKRICVEGTIIRIVRENIEQPGEPPRRVYAGAIQPAGDDPVFFVVSGTTGDLVKRSTAKLCGVVTGKTSDMPALYGLFDLPENAHPLVER